MLKKKKIRCHWFCHDGVLLDLLTHKKKHYNQDLKESAAPVPRGVSSMMMACFVVVFVVRPN